MKKLSLIPVVLLLTSACLSGQDYRETGRFAVPEARQAVAVDGKSFFVINNSTITKHDKKTGIQTAAWDGTAEGITHLNSGVVIRGKLYCASSNFPASPMAGSVEVFDAASLRHTGSHSFGIYTGSLTWIDMHDGFWYAGFAHYTGPGSSEGKDTRWTSVVKFNRKWQRLESWMFPENLIELFTPYSNSGAAWGNDGKLYTTGHDACEIYVVELPRAGHVLKHVKTISTPTYGQGIAFDRTIKNRKIIYGISRKDKLIISFEID